MNTLYLMFTITDRNKTRRFQALYESCGVEVHFLMTGSLVAALMGVPMKKAIPAIFLGVAAAGAIMLALSLGVSAALT